MLYYLLRFFLPAEKNSVAMFLFVSHKRLELRKLMIFIGTLYHAAAKKKATRLQVWERYVTLLDDIALQQKKSNVQTLNHFNKDFGA